MIRVNFIDGNSGRWGFIETVSFTAPLTQPVLAGELILEVSIKTEIFDCTDTNFQNVLRVAGPMNYGPIVENFGNFFIFGEDGRGTANPQNRPVRGPVYDFHSAYGRNKVDGLYTQGEKIRITINGTVYIQATQNTNRIRINDAFTLTTAPDQPAPLPGDEKKTGKIWTGPGLVTGNFPNPAFVAAGTLIGQPLTPKTSYKYTFIYEKCGPPAQWKGTRNVESSVQFALLTPGDGFGNPGAFGPREEGLLASLVTGLDGGSVDPIGLGASLAFQELSAVTNLVGKVAARLGSASDREAFVLVNLLAANPVPAAVQPLIATAIRFGSTEVAFLAPSIAGSSFLLSEVVGAALIKAVGRMNPGLTVPDDLRPGGDLSNWVRWLETNRPSLPDLPTVLGPDPA
jgi:hypothetical protein